MYGKNKITLPYKYSENRKADQIVDEFIQEIKIKKQNNSILNSTAYSNCLSSLKSISDSNDSYNKDYGSSTFNFSQFRNLKEKALKERFNDFTLNMNSTKINQMNRIENQKNKNLDILNFRYCDINKNQSMINYLPKFKKINSYNKRAMDYFKNNKFDEILLTEKNTNCTRCQDEILKAKVSKINVINKVNEYKNYIKYCESNNITKR
jgi:hypothetical protein